MAPENVQLEYNAGQRQRPVSASWLHAEDLQPPVDIMFFKKDFVWALARLRNGDSGEFGQENKITPGWAGFNALVSRHEIVRHSIVGYLPVIPSSPTEIHTVYKLLVRSLAVADQLKQSSVAIALDQAI